ncbi:hypothetical protein B0H11DRAFT_1077442 [Mycena galericulata]|nr:hypothetical protein B0H11DRAFT_1077442 [Mycena galericulata]
MSTLPSTLFLPSSSPSTPNMSSPPPGFRFLDNNGYPLDPFHYLRDTSAEAILDLLIHHEFIENCREALLKCAVRAAIPSLERMRRQFDKRKMPRELKELLFPLYKICCRIPDDLKMKLEPYQPRLDEHSGQYLDAGWVMPPASHFYVPVTPSPPTTPAHPTRTSGSKAMAGSAFAKPDCWVEPQLTAGSASTKPRSATAPKTKGNGLTTVPSGILSTFASVVISEEGEIR